MLIEVKVKVARIIDGKTRKRTETYLKPDCELFVEAEQAVMERLTQEQNDSLIDTFEIQSLRISPIKEVCTQFNGEFTYIATLTDIFHADDGTEKTLKYKVFLWANGHSDAVYNIQTLVRQGYEMHIQGIKEVDYEYLNEEETENDN
jgi:hypothetical protein